MENPLRDRVSPKAGNLPGKDLTVVTAGTGRAAVRLELRRQGRDWLLLVEGGEVHVGAVAVAWPGGQELVVVPGHKEGPLAARCAEEVTRASGQTCTAVAGIHQDQATPQEISAIVAHVEQALAQVVALAFPHSKPDQESDGQP